MYIKLYQSTTNKKHQLTAQMITFCQSHDPVIALDSHWIVVHFCTVPPKHLLGRRSGFITRHRRDCDRCDSGRKLLDFPKFSAAESPCNDVTAESLVVFDGFWSFRRWLEVIPPLCGHLQGCVCLEH